ncbi:MAG: hypothetical protein D6704_07850 [Nitrospirae bacterium]|nr:MAG: hypothetical protein D6704_07850 [Nitrospirota bacterium]
MHESHMRQETRISEHDEEIAVFRVEDLAPGQSRMVRVAGKRVAFFNIAGKFYAINNVCPHQGGSLAKGRVKGYVVSCPWHHLQFDVRTGFGTDGGGYCVASYETCVRDGFVYIKMRRQVK